MVALDLVENLEHQELTVNQDREEKLDHKVNLELQDNKERRDHGENQVFQDLQELEERTDNQDHRVPLSIIILWFFIVIVTSNKICQFVQ